VAEGQGRAVALLAAVPVYARRGWFFEDLLRDTAAPNGTAELLIDAAMQALAKEGCSYVTLGLAPLSGEIQPWMRAARDLGSSLYDFHGVRAFKERLRPRHWDPIFLAVPPGQPPFLAVISALAAFAQGGLFRFALATLLRGPSLVVRLLAVALVPWTLAIALVGERWFPSPTVKWAWVAFDVGLFAGLWALTHRWRHGLATFLAAAVTLDGVLTLSQVLLFNARRIHSWLDLAVVGAGLAAPWLAAVLLWGGRAHRRAERKAEVAAVGSPAANVASGGKGSPTEAPR
jgi:phosphatidylglycerol lysyltransferase